jgi:hypothetical protein
MTATRPPSKPWRVYGARGISDDYTSKRSAYEAVESIAGCGTRPGICRARVWHWEVGSWKLHETVEPIPAGHVREAATPGEDLDPPQPGILLADCSCGAEYTVPQGRDEYGALEKAHREHIAAVTVKEG